VRYEASRETVRQALREVLLEGRLRRQGRGTVSFRFRCTGSNNWYWVIDGVRIKAS
jgi:hypothetical protein